MPHTSRFDEQSKVDCLHQPGPQINAWVKWLRMQGHLLPANLKVTGSNPGPGKINIIKIEKKHQRRFLTLIKSTSLLGKKGRLSWYKNHYYYTSRFDEQSKVDCLDPK
jgi:hypothetical protein